MGYMQFREGIVGGFTTARYAVVSPTPQTVTGLLAAAKSEACSNRVIDEALEGSGSIDLDARCHKFLM
jgi:hypothetical protein